MGSLALYVFQLVAAGALLALALSIYVDGIGYLILHVVALSGVGAYAYAIATVVWQMSPLVACVAAILLGTAFGLLLAELLRTLREDDLTLVSFGAAVCTFEMLRYSQLTGGVFGMADIPAIFSTTPGGAWWPTAALLAIGVTIVELWRSSITGRVAVALRLDENGARSIGARLLAQQRFSGALAGTLATLSGIVSATATQFIEPRQFQTNAILIPLAAVIVAKGRTPWGVITCVAGIVVCAQLARFASSSAVLAGPITEIAVAATLGVTIVLLRVQERRA